MQSGARRQVFRAYDADGNHGLHGLRYCPRCGTACVAAGASGRARLRCPSCRYVHYRNPSPGVAIVVTRGAQVLLGRRIATTSFGGRWGLPAGFVEYDEDFLTAARRETREETGLEVEVTGILNVTCNFLTRELHSLVIAVAARPIGGELAAGDDLCELRWVPLAGPFPPLAYEADAELLRLLETGGAPCLPVDRRYAGEVAAAAPEFPR